jgi:hypothetical protein
MTNGREFSRPAVYQIMVRGAANQGWRSRFDEYTILPQANHKVLIMGTVRDQPALHGLLARIRDEGLILMWLRRQDW